VTKHKPTAGLFIENLQRLPHNQPGPVFLIVDGHPVRRSVAVKRFAAQTEGRLRLFRLRHPHRRSFGAATHANPGLQVAIDQAQQHPIGHMAQNNSTCRAASAARCCTSGSFDFLLCGRFPTSFDMRAVGQ
jgi:hypothetical protein